MRLPIPAVEASRSAVKRRWWLVGVAVAISIAIAVLVGSRVPRDRMAGTARRDGAVGSRVPRDRIEQYTFDEFFPSHTQQK